MTSFTDAPRLPVIDLSLFEVGNPWRDHVAAQIDWAAAEFGIFRLVNHSIDPGLIDSLARLSRSFFAREVGVEHRVRASLAGLAEFREELIFDSAFTKDESAALPAFASPDRDVFFQLPGFGDVVREYMAAVTGLSHRLMTSFARGMRLGDNYFVDRYTGDASCRLNIVSQRQGSRADARAPTDTGLTGEPALLTILDHDECARLEVTYGKHSIEVPHVPGALLCGVGKPLSRLTAGRYPPARYRLTSPSSRETLATSFSFGSGIVHHAKTDPLVRAAAFAPMPVSRSWRSPACRSP